MSSPTSTTPLEALVEQLRGCRGPADGLAEPAAILWTDPERQWASLRPLLRAALPELIELGEYAPTEHRGPAIWLRCLVDRSLDDPALPPDRPPILYLPGVARQQLRAGPECAPALRPLVELMYRGALWLQRNGYDWTVTAFLTSPHELALDISRDDDTADALLRALPEVARTPTESLRGRHLEAEDFDRLLAVDVVRDLLRWMGQPAALRESMGTERWAAFRSQCQSRFDLDPDKDDVTVAGQCLGLSEGAWSEVWSRYEEAAPQSFPGLPDLLRRSKPSTLLFEKSHWPSENDAAEEQVRSALAEIDGMPHRTACEAVLALEKEHGGRRRWVWAHLGLSPMAIALQPLAELAQHVRMPLGGLNPDDIAKSYESGGWRADAASWRALAAVPGKHEELVRGAVRCLLESWLDDSARAFQRAVNTRPLPGHAEVDLVVADEGTCVLFVDGLRYDLGRLLAEALETRGMRIRSGWRWAALPTVTATAKPAVSPVADEIRGADMPADFAPVGASDGRPVVASSLRTALERRGYQLVSGGPGDWPANEGARGWGETGEVDQRGHQLGASLAREIDPQLERLTERIASLLECGWTAVRVVTDHGWLLLPGGLPKVDLPKHLTASRWARCAAISGDSRVHVATPPWHWNPTQRFATAPGISCFNASPDYAHGGVSIQECMIPDFLVERGGGTQARATIVSVRWQGMRCFVRAEVSGGDVRADLRLERPNGPSIAQSIKPLEPRGETSLLLADDCHERAELVAVLLASDGTILAQRKTTVGANS